MPPLSLTDDRICLVDNSATSTECIKSPPPLTMAKLPKSRRTVSFAPSVGIRLMDHLDDYSQDEVEATWYSHQEYKLMKYDMRGTVKMMTRGERLSIDQCTRGIEHKTKEGMQRRMFNQIESLSAVMDEQDRQAKDGIHDDTLIAQAYMSYTALCTATAHYMALSDERIAAMEEVVDDFQTSSAPSAGHRQKRRLSCTAA